MCGRHCDVFFTPEDRANGIPQQEMGNALRHGRGIDERWHLRCDGECFWANGEMMPLTDELDQPVGFIKILRDSTEQRRERERAEEHRELLTNELKHRIKNTLSVVQAIVSQSLRNVATPEQAREAIGDRLATLAKAHDLLTQTSWSAAPIGAIVSGAVAVLGDKTGRVRVHGPDIKLNARAALALSMAIHELATNAAKYGSLSNHDGQVDMTWLARAGDDGGYVDMVWQEIGGPAVEKPTRKGFGSRLIESSLARDLGGRGTVAYLPDGIRWTLAAQRSVIEDA
jgi:two-component sensor histidine kinase